ncbi:AraC family transcriptional regulator [Pseudomonas aeruginosa]|nr:AraC family transcriptional regulator [Pseudomonas aeruginosa]
MGVSSLQPLVMPAYPLPPAWMGASDLPPDTLLFESLDLEYAQEQIGRVYRPYHFNADYRKRIGPASMFRLLGEGIQVSWFSFGTEISVEPEISDDFILVLTTLDGHADICSGRLRHRSNFGSTVVIAADALSRYRFSADNTQMGVRLDVRRVETLWQRLSGSSGACTLSRLLPPRQQERWLASVGMLKQLLNPETPSALKAILLPRAEELLMLQLLAEPLYEAGERHRRCPPSSFAPAYLKRALAFIDEHASQPLTLGEIANAACCIIRTLQRVFQNWLDIGVMQHVREVRLQRVREALLEEGRQASITEIAIQWGFSHLGQFAADYRKKYGELPSETKARMA